MMSSSSGPDQRGSYGLTSSEFCEEVCGGGGVDSEAGWASDPLWGISMTIAKSKIAIPTQM